MKGVSSKLRRAMEYTVYSFVPRINWFSKNPKEYRPIGKDGATIIHNVNVAT